MRRPTSRWMIGVVGAVAYFLLWWGAVFTAAFLAFRDVPTSDATADRIGAGIGAVLMFATFVFVGLIAAHALWVGVIGAVLSPTAIGWRFAVAITVLVGANITAPYTLRIFDSHERFGWLTLTLALPGVATWWAAGPSARTTQRGVTSARWVFTAADDDYTPS